jgi:hypothetical protein
MLLRGRQALCSLAGTTVTECTSVNMTKLKMRFPKYTDAAAIASAASRGPDMIADDREVARE